MSEKKHGSVWIKPSERLPDVDEDNEWDKKHGVKSSKRLITFSKSWGMRFGRYYHTAEIWQVEGVSSSDGVEVEYYRYIDLPE